MKRKKKLRSILSYKPIENREAILACEAVDYLKQQGFLVVPSENRKHISLALVFVIAVAICLAIIPSASALDKTYSSIENAITLKDAGNNVAHYQLLENENSVSAAHATGLVTLYEQGRLFENIRFETENKESRIINYNIYLLENVEVIERTPVIEKLCTIDILNNSVEKCLESTKGFTTSSHFEERETLYKGELLDAGNYKWRIRANRPANVPIDWIATAFDTELNEWAWWNVSWAKAKEVNVTGGAATLANFTVYLNVSYDSDMQSDFDDVRFVNGACAGAQTEELSYELDYKVNSNYAGFHVKIPSLATGNNQICMYYGNNAVASTSNGTSAFDDYYKIIMHFSDTSGHYLRNSKNGNATFMNTSSISINGNNTPGVFGRAVNLSGTGYASAGPSSSILLGANWTAELWVFSLGNTGDDQTHFAKISGAGGNNFGLWTSQGGTDQWGGCGNFNSAWNSAKAWSDIKGQWYGGSCFSQNGIASSTNVFQNKTIFTTDTGGGGGGAVAEGTWSLGFYDGGSKFGNSYYDEVRFSNITRTPAWLNRSFDNSNLSLVVFSGELNVPQGVFTDVVLLTPTNASVHEGNSFNQSLISFSARVSGQNASTLNNATLYLYLGNGTLIRIFNSTFSGNNSLFSYTVWNGTHSYNIQGCSTGGDTYSCEFAPSNFSFTVSNFVPERGLLQIDFSDPLQFWLWVIFLVIAFGLILYGIAVWGGFILLFQGLILFFSTDKYLYGFGIVMIGALIIIAAKE